MIKKTVRYDSYAYRISDLTASKALIDDGFEEGMFLTFGEDGALVKATGADTTVPMMAMSSSRIGRNQFLGKTTSAASVYYGPARIAITNFDPSQEYKAGTPLYIGTGDYAGCVTPTKGSFLVGYVDSVSVYDGYLTMYLISPVPVA